jgi:hypothetical protein
MRPINFTRPALIAAAVLLIPLVMSIIGSMTPGGNGWLWGPFDFLVMGALLYGAGLAYEFFAARTRGTKQRVAIAVLIILAAVAIWTELAVGAVSQLAGLLLGAL